MNTSVTQHKNITDFKKVLITRQARYWEKQSLL